ncbi:Ankyrin repeat-containing protein [Artemisia annua]|uniref:Ankyrin repeat-containing protein n=1 Tax=Artemisia annua TaxID=35608 RepID=A0A2U1MLK8_ARTAN|nr:Ankyrin repeat-containing protein [Artemisia annua]
MRSSTNQQEMIQICIPLAQTPSPRLPINLPSQELLEGNRENYIELGVPLYQASMNGDWKAAKLIFDKHPNLIRAAITENCETSLHVAASAKSTKKVEEFVRNLVKLMDTVDLQLHNKDYNTALNLAAAAGNVETAKIMVNKNKFILEIPGDQEQMPLYQAALFGRHDMVRYLYNSSKEMTGDFWTHENRGSVLVKSVENDLFDVALKIVNDCPELVTDKNVLRNVLSALAPKTEEFDGAKPHKICRIITSFFEVFNIKVGPAERDTQALQLLKKIWKNVAKMPKNDIDGIIGGSASPPLENVALKIVNDRPELVTDKNILRNVLSALAPKTEEFDGAKPHKICRIITSFFEVFNIKVGPAERDTQALQLLKKIWKNVAKMPKNDIDGIIGGSASPPLENDNKRSIFHIAVKRRHERIYTLLYEIGSMKDLVTPLKDIDGNNMLHLVGKSVKLKRLQTVSGVSLQMQRELIWFKEVEQMVPPGSRKAMNNAGKTPHELFTEKHTDLVSRGEKWMKDTAAQCMVVATLIATIVFAAAFTLPGGYNQNTGIPFFIPKRALIVFVISDAISLMLSSASVLMFLSILTSRYAEDDFLESLPKKLMFGLATLFLSIMTMMVTFSASFFVLYHNNVKWVPFIATGFSVLPVILFAILQFPLLKDVFYTTYYSKYLFKPKKHRLYI